MSTIIRQWVRNCDTYRRIKSSRIGHRGLL